MLVIQYFPCSWSDRTWAIARCPQKRWLGWQKKPLPSTSQCYTWQTPSSRPGRHSGAPSTSPQKAPVTQGLQLPHLRLKRSPVRKHNMKADRAGEMEDLVLRLHGGPLSPPENQQESLFIRWDGPGRRLTPPELGQRRVYSTTPPLSQAPFRRRHGCIYRNIWDSLLSHLLSTPSLLLSSPQSPTKMKSGSK